MRCAARRCGRGDRVLVVGAGPIGVVYGIFARLAGGQVTLADVSEARLAYVRDQLGFTQTILAGPAALGEMERATGGDLYDVVFTTFLFPWFVCLRSGVLTQIVKTWYLRRFDAWL